MDSFFRESTLQVGKASVVETEVIVLVSDGSGVVTLEDFVT